jgi:hypothetical protein
MMELGCNAWLLSEIAGDVQNLTCMLRSAKPIF